MGAFEPERVRPEDAGVDPRGLLSFAGAAARAGLQLHSFLLIRHGKIAAELYYQPFRRELLHNLYSCSKSITATAVGFAISEGLLSLDQPVCALLPEKLDAPAHPYVAAATVEHLLMMATPFSNFVDPLTDDWTREFLNAHPDHYPGTLFGYDTSGTHTLCEIVQKVTGQTLLQYLTPRLFTPIGITALEWEVSPLGINRGGGGVRLTTEGMARFGLLYLNHGKWGDAQILPSGWAERAVSRKIDNSNAVGMHSGSTGYGYQFWCLEEGAFACLGLGGQIIVGLPAQDAVFVTTANTINAGYSSYLALDLMKEHIYPALHSGAAARDDTAYKEWIALEAQAVVPLPDGGKTSPLCEAFLGKVFFAAEGGTPFQSAALLRDRGDFALVLGTPDGEDRIRFGMGRYVSSETPLQRYQNPIQFWGNYSFPGEPNPRQRSRCASAGVWTDSRTLIIRCHLLDTVQSFTISCYFDTGRCTVQILPCGVFSYIPFPGAQTFHEAV